MSNNAPAANKRWIIETVLYELVDIPVSILTLGLYHPNGFNFHGSTFIEQIYQLRNGLDFCRSGVEFALLSLVRLAFLMVGVVLLKSHRDTTIFGHLLTTVHIGTISFSLLKVLCFAEIAGQLRFAGVWLHVVWSILSSFTFFALWKWRISTSAAVVYSPVSTEPQPSPARQSDESSNQPEEDPVEKPKEEEPAFRESTLKQIWLLLSYARYNGFYFIAGSLFSIIYSVARVFLPFMTGEIIAQIVRKESFTDGTFNRLVLIMFILVMVCSLFGGLRGGCFSYATSLVDRSIRRDLYRSIVQQEIVFFDRAPTGEIVSRLSADTQLVSTIVSSNVNIFLRSVLMMAGSLIFMAFLSWRLTLVTFIVIPPIALILQLYSQFYDRLGERTQSATAEANHVAEEAIGSIRTVRGFAAEGREIERYEERLAYTLKVIQYKALAEVGFNWINDFAEYLVLIAILFYAGHLALRGEMTVNQVTSFLLYQLQMGEVFYYFKMIFSTLLEGVGASRKIFEYMNRKPEIQYNGAVEKPIDGQVDFKDVTFAYPTRPTQNVLKEITLRIRPGQTAAIVGPSGGGKSTVVALLERFYETVNNDKQNGGSVRLDSTPIPQFSHKFYHRQVALVSQDPVLYSGSIRYNILYGCEEGEIGEPEMIEAARLANAHQFITEMKDGYDTMCGERGIQLSGGQKQRISIARALVMNPRVLILDEATSNLDSVSEHLIQEALQKCSVGRTVIIIAHRLSTVEKADVIFVVDKGRLVQSGTHKELLSEEGGLYKKLVQRQMVLEET